MGSTTQRDTININRRGGAPLGIFRSVRALSVISASAGKHHVAQIAWMGGEFAPSLLFLFCIMADPEPPSDSAHAGDRSTSRCLAVLSATDITIQRLESLLSTVDGQESVLSTVEYVASILHHLSQSTPWIAGRLRLLAARNTKTASKRSKFQSLSALASETRCNLRLFTLLQLWSWGSETIRSPPTDPILHALTLLQVIINIVGQLLENVAYLASKGIVSKRLVNKYGGIETWYIWSTRGWLAHIYLQFFVLWRKHVLRQQRDGKFAVGAIASAEEVRAWRKSFVNNVLWAPLCVHWCLEEGIGIPESLTSLGSLLAGTWGLRDMWVATARSP